MPVLLLQLAGPMQSWGVRSRFSVRGTELAPSKSGIIGMLAAALGRRRTDPLEDLLTLRFGVRKDQPGTVMRDFHTAHHLETGRPMPLSDRYYLADAVFLAGIEGDRGLVEGLDHALRSPAFPLYLGRRSCPPAQPVSLGLREVPLLDALTAEPWRASPWFQQQHGGFNAELLVDECVQAEQPDGGEVHTFRDVPVSFDPQHRAYTFRNVRRLLVPLGTAPPDPHDPMSEPHDPMSELEEACRVPDQD